MIVLLGVPGDAPLAMVRTELLKQGKVSVLVDQRDVLKTAIDVEFGHDVVGTLRTGDLVIELNSVTAVYNRSYGLDQLPVLRNLDRKSSQWSHAINFTETISAWTELCSALVVNRLSAMASNGSKPYQSRIIQTLGFAVPDTLVTTDPNAAREFWLRHGIVVYKSISGIRSIVSRLSAENAWRLDHLRWCPTQFQQYIPGNDYRVHVVGEEVFMAEIISEADDYRYASRKGLKATLQASEIPEEVAQRCRDLARALNLPVAGIDLRYHPAGAWFCFEVNPSPAFSYYEAETGQPIAAAVAQLLARATTASQGN
jgi:glutathione synthase/RimK-type ligase-like ATP-grasp enzyme